MSELRRLQIRRTAIVVAIFGSFVAAFWLVLRESDKEDRLQQPGEPCLYLVSGRELCGDRAVKFCDRADAERSKDDRGGRETCARIRRQVQTG